MGLADKLSIETPVAGVPAPAHQQHIPVPPEPDVHIAQPNDMPAQQLVLYLQALFGGGGHPADVYPQQPLVRHPGPNQAIMEAPEPNPPLLPVSGMVGFPRRARVRLVIAALLIAISIRQGPGAVNAPCVGNVLGAREHAVGAGAVVLGAAATQITATLRPKPMPMVTGRPAIH